MRSKKISLSLTRAVILVFTLSLFALIAWFLYNRGTSNLLATGGDKRAVSQKAAKIEEPPLPDTVTVAFYNVENLFDFNLDGTEYDEYKPDWYGWTEAMQKKKMRGTASVIAAIGADVIGLCEVENFNALKELQAELDAMDAPYPFATTANAPKSATVTALLSKFPIKEKYEYPVEKSRSILEALISRGGDSLTIFVNHWPSKRHAESNRLEAAQTLTRRIENLPQTADYIIIGDMNSNYDEFATFHTDGFNDTKGLTGINHILKTVVDYNAGSGAPARPKFVCKGELAECRDCRYNLWLDVAEEKRMSYVYRGAKQTIDNIIAPPSMFDSVGYSYLDSSFEAFTWDGELMRDGVPYRWQMTYNGKRKYHAGHGYSDHLPVRAKFIKASVLQNDTTAYPPARSGVCEAIDPNLQNGDFAVSVDGWVSGDARFTVSRDKRFARTGTHGLHISGRHDTQNRTAAKVKLEIGGGVPKYATLSIRGHGNLSIRIKRPLGNWVYYNAPDLKQASKGAKYKGWTSNSWTELKIPVPAESGGGDVDLELRAGKGEPFSIWIDRVRLVTGN